MDIPFIDITYIVCIENHWNKVDEMQYMEWDVSRIRSHCGDAEYENVL